MQSLNLLTLLTRKNQLNFEFFNTIGHLQPFGKPTAVVRRGRRSRSPRPRGTEANRLELRQFRVLWRSNCHRESEVFTEHRSIDRLQAWRYSGGQRKKWFDKPVRSRDELELRLDGYECFSATPDGTLTVRVES
jgi:hypothetical protein